MRNGRSLCRLHHATYDAFLLAVGPDYSAEISRVGLEELDGSMLRHGLQAMHNMRILTPRAADQKPDRNLLQERLERFRGAG